MKFDDISVYNTCRKSGHLDHDVHYIIQDIILG